jgi:hypothetical protein
MGMNDEKVRKFIALAGQAVREQFGTGNAEQRKLGAHLLLSEVLEYVIDGLGVTPSVQGVAIKDPESVRYEVTEGVATDERAMLDGLADVAYTMYWNALTFGLPLDAAYEMVCDNNLEKFVPLGAWAERSDAPFQLPREEWDCRLGVQWPVEVTQVQVVAYKGKLYGVGKDARGKVRKPSTYTSVDLTPLMSKEAEL